MATKNFEELNQSAETIRSNTYPRSNTAGLVGGLFKDIIAKLEEACQGSQVSISNLTATTAASANAVVATFRYVQGNQQKSFDITLQGATDTNAGLLTPALLSSITSQVNAALTAATTEAAERRTADSSLQTQINAIKALAEAAAPLETLNREISPVVNIKDLDAMTSVDYCCERSKLYNVVNDSGVSVGKMFLLSDEMMHTITQILFSFYEGYTDDNSLTPDKSSGYQHTPSILWRSFVYSVHGTPNQWTRWTAVGNEKLEEIYEGLEYFLQKSSVTQSAGQSTEDVMSQDAVTKLIGKLCDYLGLSYTVDDETGVVDISGTIDTELLSGIEARTFINANVLFGYSMSLTFADMRTRLEGYSELVAGGTFVTFLSPDGWITKQFLGESGDDIKDAEKWKDIGGGMAAIGNCYNVTNEVPISGYYDLETAVRTAFDNKKTAEGMQITFAIAKGSWKTYQYVGSGTGEDNFTNITNWLDLAGMSAGAETLININILCASLGMSLNNDCYTLQLAIATLKRLQADSGIEYAKPGLVITYKIDNLAWETKQFRGEVADFEAAELWQDFGGGGGTVIETSDTPSAHGTDAFSTGGAYEHLITDFDEQIDEGENTKTYQAITASGKAVGNPIIVPLSGGGGSASGTSLSIAFENNPLYAPFGGQLSTRAAIRSVTVEGDEVLANFIRRVEIVDATTNVTLIGTDVNKASSSSMQDYSFDLDFTPFFSQAARREFTIVASDDEGNVRRKNITVTAVDVTVQVSGVQTLHYTPNTVLTVGATTNKSLSMYKFPNNASDKGIRCVVEMLWQGEWRQLGSDNLITDTYAKSISINPSNVFGGGERMEHGAYPIRIQGTDVASGVKGNTVYTSVMCVDKDMTTPIAVLRYNDRQNGTIKLYESATLEVAAYTPGATSTPVRVLMNDTVLTSITAFQSQTHTVRKQVHGFRADGTQQLTFKALAFMNSVVTESNSVTLRVQGSAIAVALKEGARFAYDFSGRSNEETDHTIADSGVTMDVIGSNWSSNGFGNFLGENCLRIAENVRAKVNYSPFGASSVEDNGCAVQFAFATKNIKDADAMLMQCYDEASGVGFYVKGNVAGIYCAKGIAQREERKFKCSEKVTMAVVVEPSSIYKERSGVRYSNVKMYLNGEEVACLGYVPGTGSVVNLKNITFDGTEGDIYMYYLMAYESHYQWAQAFSNYLVKLTDTTAMMDEYDFENVLDATGKPTLESMRARGIPYYIIITDEGTFATFDGDVNTSTKFSVTLEYHNPQFPCLDFRATNVQWRRQGTTSAKRPVKNDRFYLNKPVDKKKPTVITLLNPDSTTELGRRAIALAALNYVMVQPNAIPVQIITVKVDYSDSSNANDCGVCNMMNATFRALGNQYLTPAQRHFDGTFDKGDLHIDGLVMDHSTKNHPIAVFRATNEALTDAYFHAKGNWKEDKAEQLALGFKNTPGYNKGCRNYGDFTEYFGTRGETLNQIEERFKADYETYAQYLASIEGITNEEDKPQKPAGMVEIDTSKLYLLSQYCGRDYRFMRYKNGAWAAQTGSMRQVNGKWQVTGDVLNPVTGFELLNYQGMDWWQGVGSVDDMMEMKPDMSSWVKKLVDGGSISATRFPAWTFYFECMIDDDQLAIDLALGKKVPYDLYRMLKFCNDCDYSNPALATTWSDKWKREVYKYASVHSLYAYTLFTDYLAAVDQRAKNMQPMWFLEDGFSVTNGVYSSEDALKMYLNKIYDCDTCNEKDNDGGCTVDAECDPNKPSVDGVYTNPYAGWGSILFNNIDKCPEVYTNSDGTLLSLKTVAAAMRSCQTVLDDGRVLHPFSPEGAYHYFVESRLKFWPKIISSYDGERKYISFTATSDAIYFYALQGLGLTSLPRFIEQRWRIRDGYYQTGQFFSGVLSGRIACASGAVIRMRAAKTGYFGIGNDASGNLSESVYLEAGQEHTFTNFSHETGALLYIYQADRMSELDLSELSLDNNFNFSVMSLVETLKIGSQRHEDKPIGSYSPLTTIILGDLPFLRELDLRNTLATSVNCSQCPRLRTLLAEGCRLTSCSLAETSPVSTVHLPETMTEIQLVNLPELSYPGGLQLASLANVTRLMVSGCPHIDAMELIENVSEASSLRYIRLANVNITASAEILKSLMQCGARGLDHSGVPYDEEGQCSGVTGLWIMKELLEDDEFSQIDSYFPELEVYNSQFSVIKMRDDIDDPAGKMTNLDNNTGQMFGNKFTQSGHLLRIERNTHAYKCTYNERLKQMEGVQLSDTDFNFLADGTEFDITDRTGEGFDIFWHLCHCWYKGVNDYKNQAKYYIWSSCQNEPMSTASRIVRRKLADILHADNSGVYVGEAEAGAPLSDDVIATAANTAVYKMDVDGMKQVRWPGLNNNTLGCVFTDAEDVIISTFKMAVSNAAFDFTTGDYIFCDVPAGARYFYFTEFRGYDDQECIAVDSSHIEAIEPDWVEHKAADNGNACDEDSLIGVYPVTMDALMRVRSISSTGPSRKGTGTSTTSAGWLYDDDGNPTNTPNGTLNYTMKDLINLCRRRYPGAQSIDYEQHKETAILWWCCRGNLQDQGVVGNGQHDGRLNQMDNIGMADSQYNGNSFNSIMGLKGYIGCDCEWMDNIALNVTSFEEFWKRRGEEYSAFPLDAVVHIYDPIRRTERTLPFPNPCNANNVARVIHGRRCDIIASRLETDTSRYVTNFCAGHWYANARSRAVLRSGSNSNAGSGFAYAVAYNGCSYSGAYYGARLSFRGKFVIIG